MPSRLALAFFGVGPGTGQHSLTAVCTLLALQVCRGTAVTMVSPTTGAEEIANPFLAAEEQQ